MSRRTGDIKNRIRENLWRSRSDRRTLFVVYLALCGLLTGTCDWKVPEVDCAVESAGRQARPSGAKASVRTPP